ncbi:MAG: hypothetical protein PHE55_07295 [Methylococcaceae bacterium]|nr:hypothetical protein [Methylococcaceae bacterium]
MSKRYREYVPSLLMLGFSAILTVILLMQWLHYRNQQADLRNRLSVKPEVHLETSTQEGESYDLPGQDEYTALVERPLFMEGRRPATDEGSASESVSVEKTPLTVKLMGVIFTPQDKLGLFLDAQGKYKRAHKNGVIGGWKVAEIQPDKVIMEQGDAKEELKLLKPKPKTTPSKPPGGKAEVQVPGSAPAEDVDNPDTPTEESVDSEPTDETGNESDSADQSDESDASSDQ